MIDNEKLTQNGELKSEGKSKRGRQKKVNIATEKVNNSPDIFDTLREYQKYINDKQLLNDNVINYLSEKNNVAEPINKISLRSGILKEFYDISSQYRLINPNELLSIAMFEFIKKYK